MRYVLARSEEVSRERAYRIYVTDALRALCGSKSDRYADLFKPEDKRTPQEIIKGISEKLGGDNGSI